MTRYLREFCGTWSCFVVLSRDKCNGCHVSSRLMTQQNQLSTFLILPEIFTPSNYEPGGREFESLRARHIEMKSGVEPFSVRPFFHFARASLPIFNPPLAARSRLQTCLHRSVDRRH